jgi:hypothetical protein
MLLLTSLALFSFVSGATVSRVVVCMAKQMHVRFCTMLKLTHCHTPTYNLTLSISLSLAASFTGCMCESQPVSALFTLQLVSGLIDTAHPLLSPWTDHSLTSFPPHSKTPLYNPHNNRLATYSKFDNNTPPSPPIHYMHPSVPMTPHLLMASSTLVSFHHQ